MTVVDTTDVTRNERVDSLLDTMVASEPQIESVPMVDILSGGEGDAVAFTSAWETE